MAGVWTNLLSVTLKADKSLLLPVGSVDNSSRLPFGATGNIRFNSVQLYL